MTEPLELGTKVLVAFSRGEKVNDIYFGEIAKSFSHESYRIKLYGAFGPNASEEQRRARLYRKHTFSFPRKIIITNKDSQGLSKSKLNDIFNLILG